MLLNPLPSAGISKKAHVIVRCAWEASGPLRLQQQLRGVIILLRKRSGGVDGGQSAPLHDFCRVDGSYCVGHVPDGGWCGSANGPTNLSGVHTVDVDYISSHCSLPSDTYLAVVFTTRAPPNTTRLAANTTTSLSTDTCNVPPTCRYM